MSTAFRLIHSKRGSKRGNTKAEQERSSAMNDLVLDWCVEGDPRSLSDYLHPANHKKSSRHDSELLELLWQDGNIVTQRQAHYRLSAPSVDEHKLPLKPENPTKHVANSGGSCIPIQDETIASWLQYHVDDSMEKDMCSELLYGGEEERCGFADEHLSFQGSSSMLIPDQGVRCSIPRAPEIGNEGVVNFPFFSRPTNTDFGSLSNPRSRGRGIGDENMLSIGESLCRTKMASSSVKAGGCRDPCGANADSLAAAVTSSSCGSRGSFGKGLPRSNGDRSRKRKGSGMEESEYLSEDADDRDLSPKNKPPPQRSASTHRSRSAEVHNLSERRRRDRINEKMKALQELIPHCNKTDKASMLDDAIKYLKSLQQQLQLMWMRGGIAPVMFPGVTQQYLSSQAGSRTACLAPHPSIPSPIQLPGAPPANQMPMFSPIPLNPYTNQIQGARIPESYAWYLGMQCARPPPQAMNIHPYASRSVIRANEADVVTGCGSMSPKVDES